MESFSYYKLVCDHLTALAVLSTGSIIYDVYTSKMSKYTNDHSSSVSFLAENTLKISNYFAHYFKVNEPFKTIDLVIKNLDILIFPIAFGSSFLAKGILSDIGD